MDALLLNRLSNLVGVFSVVLLVAALTLTTLSVTSPEGIGLPFRAQEQTCDRTDPNQLCDASVTLRMYLDWGGTIPCNRRFDPGRDIPIANAPVRFYKIDSENNEQELTESATTTSQDGFASLHPTVDLFEGEKLKVEVQYPEEVTYRGVTYRNPGECSNSWNENRPGRKAQRILSMNDFDSFRSAYIEFRGWAELGQGPGITETPTPSETPTSTPSLTPTEAPTPGGNACLIENIPEPAPPWTALPDCACGIGTPTITDATLTCDEANGRQMLAFSWDGEAGRDAIAFRVAVKDLTEGNWLFGYPDISERVDNHAVYQLPDERRGHQFEIYVRRVGYERLDGGAGRYCRSAAAVRTLGPQPCPATPTPTSSLTPTETPTPPLATATPSDVTQWDVFQLDIWGVRGGRPDPDSNFMCYVAWDTTKPHLANPSLNGFADYDGPDGRRCEWRVTEPAGVGAHALGKVTFINRSGREIEMRGQATNCKAHPEITGNNKVRCDRDDQAEGEWWRDLRQVNGFPQALANNEAVTCTLNAIWPYSISCQKSTRPPQQGGPAPGISGTPGTGGTISGAVTVEGYMPGGYYIEVAAVNDEDNSDRHTVTAGEGVSSYSYEFKNLADGARYTVVAAIFRDKEVGGRDQLVSKSEEVTVGSIQNFVLSTNSTIDAAYEIINESNKEINSVAAVICARGDVDVNNCQAAVRGYLNGDYTFTFYVDKRFEPITVGQRYAVGCEIYFEDGSFGECRPFGVVEGGKRIALTYTVKGDGRIESQGTEVGPGRGTQIPDVNFDGYVDGADVAAVVASYGAVKGQDKAYNPRADFCGPAGDGSDGVINAYEISCLIRDWNPRR